MLKPTSAIRQAKDLLTHGARAALRTMPERRSTSPQSASLFDLRRQGFAPNTIIDVGAWRGDGAREMLDAFPDVDLVLIEGNPQHARDLEALTAVQPRATVIPKLVGATRAERAVLWESGDSASTRSDPSIRSELAIGLPMSTLDDVIAELDPLLGPILLRLDVDGAELDVLAGAANTLRSVDAVMLKAPLLPNAAGAPDLAETMRAMADAGFVAFDIASQRRSEDGHALMQVELIYVRRESPLRRPANRWHTSEALDSSTVIDLRHAAEDFCGH